MIQQMLAVWSLAPLTFLKPVWTSGSSRFAYCWSLQLQLQLCGSLSILWYCLSLGLEWKLTFSSPVATAEFSKLLAYWVQHFHSIIFQDLNSSTGMPSPPLALFVVMLSKAHLTSHSRMSGSRSFPYPRFVNHRSVMRGIAHHYNVVWFTVQVGNKGLM